MNQSCGARKLSFWVQLLKVRSSNWYIREDVEEEMNNEEEKLCKNQQYTIIDKHKRIQQEHRHYQSKRWHVNTNKQQMYICVNKNKIKPKTILINKYDKISKQENKWWIKSQNKHMISIPWLQMHVQRPVRHESLWPAVVRSYPRAQTTPRPHSKSYTPHRGLSFLRHLQ